MGGFEWVVLSEFLLLAVILYYLRAMVVGQDQFGITRTERRTNNDFDPTIQGLGG